MTNPKNRRLKRPTEAWAQIGDLNARYLDWGGDGPPIIALHGLASSAHWYDIVAQVLRDHGRIIAPDQRGHGPNHPGSYRVRLADPFLRHSGPDGPSRHR